MSEASPDPLDEFRGITKFGQRGNARLLQETLAEGEQMRVVAFGSDTPLDAGILCLTDRRLLFVRQRVFARPIVISIALGDIDDVSLAERPVSAVLTVTQGGKKLAFDVTPKMRAWNLFWPIKKCEEERASKALP
jgi:hypothetical protein